MLLGAMHYSHITTLYYHRLSLERRAIARARPGARLLLSRSAKYHTPYFILRAKFSINDWFGWFLRQV